MGESRDIQEYSISAPVLVYYWDKYKEQYEQDYPKVRDPQALIEGIEKLCTGIGNGEMPDGIMLYVIEDDNLDADPEKANYIITLSRETAQKSNKSGYAIKLFYVPTGEMESISTFEESRVVWSPDTMYSTQHQTRTLYYMGFAYMLCEKSPGFDLEPLPEFELTGAELLALGIEGELPPEIIEIALPEEQEEITDVVEEIIDMTLEEDDTTVETVVHDIPDNEELNRKEEEYDDLFVDYEELFDD